MKNFINFYIAPHCFDSRIFQREIHAISQILHLSEETSAEKGQKRWRQLLPKVLLEHPYQMSLCDSPTPQSLAQSYQSLLFLGSALCCLLSVIGKIHAVSVLPQFYSKRATYIPITDVFMALSLMFLFVQCFRSFFVGEKDASI